MTPHPARRVKAPPTTGHPRPAELAPAPAAGSAPKNAARKGALAALPPATQHRPGRARVVAAWLTITATGIPRARSRCACGRDRTARGREPVLALITDHAHHRTVCPLRCPETAGGGAA
jgi:hypothetical protein